MGILDWFKNRSAQFDTESADDMLIAKAVDKAVSLVNPRLKLIDNYEDALRPAVSHSVAYLRKAVTLVGPAVSVAAGSWDKEPVLRAFFARSIDLSEALGRSRNVRIFFEKYPDVDHAYVVLGMTYEERSEGTLPLYTDLRGSEPGKSRRVADFSVPRVRICGQTEREVRRLLGIQSFEYLVAQAMESLSEAREARLELEDSRTLIRARLRMLQQQGPGLGSLFEEGPESVEQRALEARLLENEHQLEQLGDSGVVLETELDALRSVLSAPEHYLRFESTCLHLSTLNVVLGEEDTDNGSDVNFTMAILLGKPGVRRAFVIGRLARAELPITKLDIANAERYL